MAGPTAAILLPQPLDGARRSLLRLEVEKVASAIEDKDFWVNGRPLIISGPDYKEELTELEQAGASQLLGWTPRDIVTLSAMCNQREDHRILGELCLRLARLLDGVIDLGGTLHLPETLPGDDSLAPAALKNPHGLRGIVFLLGSGEETRFYLCDAEFLASWLSHPSFHMVK